MMLHKAISTLMLASMLAPSLGVDLINPITDKVPDLCIDVGGIFDPSDPEQAQLAAEQKDALLCDLSSFNNAFQGTLIDVSSVAGFLPTEADGLDFSMELGTACFPLKLRKDAGEPGQTLMELQSGTCVDVIIAFGIAVVDDGKTNLCVGNNCNRRSRSRNLLQDAITLNQQDDLYQDLSNKCADHEYDVSLYVDSHMVALASPKQDAIAAGCPFLATHSKYDHESNKYEKEVFAWMDNHHVVDRAFNHDSHVIGTFKGSELAKAHESIDLSNHHQGAYDIISNNCAALMLDWASALDVKIDTKLTTFVARRLFQSSSKDMVARIRNSVNFKSLFSGRNLRSAADESTTDRELIDLLVKKNTEALVQ